MLRTPKLLRKMAELDVAMCVERSAMSLSAERERRFSFRLRDTARSGKRCLTP